MSTTSPMIRNHHQVGIRAFSGMPQSLRARRTIVRSDRAGSAESSTRPGGMPAAGYGVAGLPSLYEIMQRSHFPSVTIATAQGSHLSAALTAATSVARALTAAS